MQEKSSREMDTDGQWQRYGFNVYFTGWHLGWFETKLQLLKDPTYLNQCNTNTPLDH